MGSIVPLVKATTLLGASLLLQSATLARADNPIVQTIYTADPAPIVHDGRLYVFTGHDEDNSDTFNMLDWRLFSSDDMANWQHHGVVMDLATFAWADLNAWAGQVIQRNGKFYFYAPIRRRGGGMAIGVGVSDSIDGPYVDAIGGPLLENAEIDPTVFIDDDGQAYLYWGNPNLWYVKLNEDMVSYSGDLVQVPLTAEGFGVREGNPDRPTMYEEGPWLYKRGETYYLHWAAKCCSEDLRYSTGPSATGPWTYGGLVMATSGRSFTNHPGVVEYGGQPYLFYHNGALPGGSGYGRSVAVESFNYGADGSIPELTMTDAGPEQIKTLDPFVRQEAETIAWAEGAETETHTDGGVYVTDIQDGGYIKVSGVDFGSDGAATFTASVASESDGGAIEVRLGGVDGELVASASVSATGGSWESVTAPVTGATGLNDLFFVFVSGGFDFDWWQFE